MKKSRPESPSSSVDLNRRDFIRLSSLITVAGGSVQLQGCNRFPRHRLRVSRESDMTLAEVVLEGIDRASDDTELSWSDGNAARVTIIFQPQHILEGAYTPAQTPHNPVPARISGTSTVVLRPPSNGAGSIPFDLSALLETLQSWVPVVDPRAAPAQGVALPAPGLPQLPAVQSVGAFLGQVRRRRNAANSPSARENGSPFGSNVPPSALGDAPWMKPAEDVTQIELPFRLLLSPSEYARFLHASEPVTGSMSDATGLWTTRLAGLDPFGSGPSDRFPEHRTVRAIWTRDLNDNGALQENTLQGEPFTNMNGIRRSLGAIDRRNIALQSSHPELTDFDSGQDKPADAIRAERLWLSALGGALDVRGEWTPSTVPGMGGVVDLVKWLHRGTLGRDHYVETANIGQLWPFGVRASLVRVTERTNEPEVGAVLRQRVFILVNQPTRTWTPGPNADEPTWRQAPFRSVSFLDTAFEVDWVGDPPTKGTAILVVHPGGGAVEARIRLEDRLGEVHETTANMVFHTLDFLQSEDEGTLNAALAGFGRIPFDGCAIAYADADDPAGVVHETHELTWEGTFDEQGRALPVMVEASIAIDALRDLLPDSDAGVAPVPMELSSHYLQNGLGGGNPQKVLLEVLGDELPAVDFGTDSRRSGGFLSPSFRIGGISAATGPIGGDANTFATQGFQPESFFADALPRLFGILRLTDIIDLSSAAPRIVSTATDELESLIADVERFIALGQAPLPMGFESAASILQDAVDEALAAIDAAASGDLPGLTDRLGDLADHVGDLTTELAGLSLPTDPGLKQLQVVLRRLENTLDTAAVIVSSVNAAAQAIRNREVQLTWDAPLREIPGLFVPGDQPLTLSVVARAAGGPSDAGVDLTARIEDFTLLLFGVVEIPVDLLQFITRSGSKPDIDVKLGNTQFSGVLRFVQVLMEIIPLDGFSDPPAIEVSPSGLLATLSLPLPNVSVGVFSIENMSLSASIDIPFIGDAILFRFGFSSRDNPFVITVMCIGGGGYFGMEATPGGLRLIETALEARASLSLDFGVASGSVSMAVGIFLNLQLAETGEDGEILLVGYVRIRGEVSVLGIISASLTLELSMSYQSAGNKIHGEASLTVEVSVLFFSASVTIRCRRQLSGDNQDPTFLDTMAPVDPEQPLIGANNVDTPWAQYVNAFA